MAGVGCGPGVWTGRSMQQALWAPSAGACPASGGPAPAAGRAGPGRGAHRAGGLRRRAGACGRGQQRPEDEPVPPGAAAD
eukprot:5906119-Lingulodinium_polyedra.AAC.1